MLEPGFVTRSEWKAHIQTHPFVAHDIWPRIKDYVPTYGYSRADIDAMFEGYSGGGKAQIDAANVIGLTQGSIPFAAADGSLTEDNANLFWLAGSAHLGVHETTPTALVHINSIGGSIPALNLESGAEGELVTPDGQALRIGHWNAGTTTFTERMKMDAAGGIFISYFTAGHVLFSAANGELIQDANKFYYNVATHSLGVGAQPTNPLYVTGIGTTAGWGGAYGGIVARFLSSENKHTGVVIDAQGGYDAVLGFSKGAVVYWAIRNDHSGGDAFQIRRHFGVNRTDFEITAAGAVNIPTGSLTLSQTLVLNSVVDAGADVDKFLVLDAGNRVDYRTGVELVSDISGDIKGTDVEVEELGAATFDDVQDYINFFGDRGRLTGGAITDAGGGVATVAALTAWVKVTDSNTAVGEFVDFVGANTPALTDGQTNYIFLDYNGGAPQLVVSTSYLTHGLKQDHMILGCVYRNGAALHIHEAGELGIARSNKISTHLLEEHGAHRVSGLVTTDGGALALDVTAGIIYIGNCRHAATIDGSVWSTWYYDGDLGPAAWVEVAAQNTVDNANYNDVATGLAALTPNRYAVHWVFCDYTGGNMFLVYGQGDYTLAQAIAATAPASLPNIATNFGVLIAKIIVKEGQAALTIYYPWTTEFSAALATDHGNLAGLSDDDHPQYYNAARHTKAVHDALGLSHDSLVDVSIDDHHARDHAVEHGPGGDDALKLDDLAVPDDNTDLDFSTAKHGLVPKGTDVGHFLRDDGAWAAAAGGDDEKVAVDDVAVAGYLGAASNDGVLRVDAPLTYVDGGNFVTLGLDIYSIQHHDLGGLGDDDHPQYILHSLAAAANDFLIASGANTFVKKTLAETGAILESDINHDNLQGFVAAEHLLVGAIDHDALLNFVAAEHLLVGAIDHDALLNFVAAEHLLVGAIDHDALLNFEADEHLALPNTLANVLSDHNVAAHNALGITTLGTLVALTLDGQFLMDTDTGAQRFYITRNGGTSQSLGIYVDDNWVYFLSEQDEDAGTRGGFIFSMDDDGTQAPYFLIKKKSGAELFKVDEATGLVTFGSLACAGVGHDGFSDYVAAEHLLVGAIDHDSLLNYVAAEHLLVGAIDHNSLLNYAANRHVVLPGTIANVLSNHTKAVHDALNIDADTLDNLNSTDFLRSNVDDNLTAAIIVPTANRDEGIFGTYDSTKRQHIWSMGTAYRCAADGSSFGNLYGLGYRYNSGASGHGVYLVNNGSEKCGLGTNVWTSGVFISTKATGVAPLTVASTTKVTNLNADLLDNYHASSAAGNNTIVLRTGSGYVYCSYLNCTSGETTNNPTHYFYESGNDSFLRQSTPANFITQLAADGLMPKSGGTFTGAAVAADHGAAATDQIVNVCYGTGSPPVANTTTIGTLWIKYV